MKCRHILDARGHAALVSRAGDDMPGKTLKLVPALWTSGMAWLLLLP